MILTIANLETSCFDCEPVLAKLVQTLLLFKKRQKFAVTLLYKVILRNKPQGG